MLPTTTCAGEIGKPDAEGATPQETLRQMDCTASGNLESDGAGHPPKEQGYEDFDVSRGSISQVLRQMGS